MVGTAVVRVPIGAVTATVAALSLFTVVYPGLVPVTVTVMVWPSWAAVRVKLDPVAPEMLVPPAFHWNANEMGAGPQVPGSTVSADPTSVLPEMVGMGATRVPSVTAEVAMLVVEAVANPASVPVTVTVMVWPALPAGIVNVVPVAPEMFAPLDFH